MLVLLDVQVAAHEEQAAVREHVVLEHEGKVQQTLLELKVDLVVVHAHLLGQLAQVDGLGDDLEVEVARLFLLGRLLLHGGVLGAVLGGGLAPLLLHLGHRARQPVGEQRVLHAHQVSQLPLRRLHGLVLVLRLEQLEAADEVGEAREDEGHAVLDLLAHQFGEPVHVVVSLGALRAVEILVLVVCVLVVGELLVRAVRAAAPLLEVAVEEAADQLDDDLLEPPLARHVERHALEKDALPQVVQLACVELKRLVWDLVARHGEVEQLP